MKLKKLKAVSLSLCAILLYRTYYSENNAGSRGLSINLGNGNCEWTLPIYDIPEDINFYKTMVVGYPSGDKRLTFVQMEALTGWAAKDEWDFEYLGITNNPFVKANYPHHEGIWGWGDVGDQVVMVVRNVRRSMVEYHDILWDIGYAKTWHQANEHLGNLYQERPPLEDFLVWRDLRVMDEVHWYGWFIDYWMEGGLMRDMFTHKITTPEHWYMLMQPTVFPKSSMTYELIVGDQKVTPTYDPHCLNDVSNGCHPVQIISGERLVKADTGPAEGRKIAMTLQNHTGISEYLIEEEAWGCIWTELIVNKKGLKTFIDREGVTERDYNFSTEMLDEMLTELDRLITKYRSRDWYWRQTSKDLVDLLEEHKGLVMEEHLEVLRNERPLRDDDFLGPEERKRRKLQRIQKQLAEENELGHDEAAMQARHLVNNAEENQKDYSDFFWAIERKLLENRKDKIKAQVFEDDAKVRSLFMKDKVTKRQKA